LRCQTWLAWVVPALIRELANLSKHPYIIVYEVHEAQGEVHVLYIVHGAQDRESGNPPP
jgi:plasmid stabilization system protein ParE